MKKSGFKSSKAMLNKITPEIEAKFAKANRENAEEIVDLAQVLIPINSGTSRRLITNKALEGGAQLVDFGPIARILEGGTEVRQTKQGYNRGKGPVRAFARPSIRATAKKRKARNRKAIKDAIKAVK